MDLMGRFSRFPDNCHEYLLVGYNYDDNSILVELIKTRQANNISDKWEKINQQFATSGVQPHTYVLDNEVSNTLNKVFEEYTVNCQLGPPHSHCANKAERVIQTFNDHFKAGLATLYPYFNISHWYLMLTQAFIT